MIVRDLDQFKTVKELREFAEKLIETTIALKAELQQTKDKLAHLEEITKYAASPISVGSNEEELCKLEIRRLYDLAKNRPLEFNEAKAFDIYVKSLMLIRGKTDVEASKKNTKKDQTLSPEQLIELALQATDESNEQ